MEKVSNLISALVALYSFQIPCAELQSQHHRIHQSKYLQTELYNCWHAATNPHALKLLLVKIGSVKSNWDIFASSLWKLISQHASEVTVSKSVLLNLLESAVSAHLDELTRQRLCPAKALICAHSLPSAVCAGPWLLNGLLTKYFCPWSIEGAFHRFSLALRVKQCRWRCCNWAV